MGTIAERNNGANLDRLSDKMRRFALEYIVDFSGVRSVIAAGYSKKGAKVTAHRLLNHPVIKAFIGKYQRQSRERLELKAEEILEQLTYCATRSGADFVDDQGVMIQNIHDLPERAQQAIDGIEQEIWYDKEGDKHVKTKLKLVGKGVAIRLAMEHKGLFAPQQHDHKVLLDLDSLHTEKPKRIDVVAKRLEEDKEQSDG